MARKVVASIQVCFERITDPRVDRGRNHNLLEMIFITICAVVGGADGWADVERFGKAKRAWFEQFLNRVLSASVREGFSGGGYRWLS